MYNIYMTQYGESLGQIAFHHYGRNDPAFVNQLALANPSLRLQGGTEVMGGILEPFQAIALPDNLDQSALNTHQMIVDTINNSPRDDRYFLRQLLDQGIDPNLLLAAAEASYIPPHEKKDSSKVGEAIDLSMALADAAIETSLESDETFSKKLTKLERRLRIHKILPLEYKSNYFNNRIKPAYKEAITAYNRIFVLSYKKRAHIPGVRKLRHLSYKTDFTLRNIGDVDMLLKSIPYKKFLGHCAIALDISTRYESVKEVYEKNGN
jgi:phage tail protein X